MEMPNPCLFSSELKYSGSGVMPESRGMVDCHVERPPWWFSVQAVFLGHHENSKYSLRALGVREQTSHDPPLARVFPTCAEGDRLEYRATSKTEEYRGPIPARQEAGPD